MEGRKRFNPNSRIEFNVGFSAGRRKQHARGACAPQIRTLPAFACSCQGQRARLRLTTTITITPITKGPADRRKVRLLALLTLAVCVSPVWAADAARPLKALLVTGGCCHDYTQQKKILSDGISARANVVWTIVQEGDNREHKMSIYTNANWARGYDVIVHNACFGFVNDDAFVETIAAAHRRGVPAVMLHCSMHSYRTAKTDEWRKCVGLSSYSHEKGRDLTVKNLQPDHPVMKDFPEVWHDAQDELYKNETVWPELIPLAQAYGEETKRDHIVIWLNTYGKGRVFATTLGHGNSTMQSEVYLDLIARGLLWVCEKLSSDGKPKPGYAAAQKQF